MCPSTTFISALPIFSPSNNYYYIFQLVEQRAQDKVSHFPNSFYYVSTPLLFVWIFLCLAVIIRGKCVPLTGIKSIGDHDDDGFPCVVLFFADLNPWHGTEDDTCDLFLQGQQGLRLKCLNMSSFTIFSRNLICPKRPSVFLHTPHWDLFEFHQEFKRAFKGGKWVKKVFTGQLNIIRKAKGPARVASLNKLPQIY